MSKLSIFVISHIVLLNTFIQYNKKILQLLPFKKSKFKNKYFRFYNLLYKLKLSYLGTL